MEVITLAINAGSSSREYALYKDREQVALGYYEHEEDTYTATLTFHQTSDTITISQELFNTALEHFLTSSRGHGIKSEHISLCGIRVVAPGRALLKHQEFTLSFREFLESRLHTAPLHITTALREYDQVVSVLSDCKVYAISDSAFHHSLSYEARNYAINRSDAEAYDIYRFGYHGLSVQSIVAQFDPQPEKMIVCHLGSGASITAVHNGKSIDTSMGYSPLEGLVMATRSGSIDVKAALDLKKALNLDDDGIIDYLNKQSGLLGLSRHSNDIRVLLKQEAHNDDAKLALSLMIYRIKQYIGAYSATLGGIDTLVFTATVGERSSIVRERVCTQLEYLGISLDKTKNNETKSNEITTISSDESAVRILVVPTNEVAQLYTETMRLKLN